MKYLILTLLALLALAGCNQDSAKVSRQKEIYFASMDVPRLELEKEITKTMEKQHLQTQGQAMLYILNQSIASLPLVDGIVSDAIAKAGVTIPPDDSLDAAADRIKLAKQIQALIMARDSIARIEAENGK